MNAIAISAGPLPQTREGQVLMAPLVEWLHATRRLRFGSALYPELPWAGRRIDLVTLGTRLRTNAFELKLGATGRALEQAIYNRQVFDRSYVVLAHTPSNASLRVAADVGVGAIVITEGSVRLVLDSPVAKPSQAVRARLLALLRARRPWEPLP